MTGTRITWLQFKVELSCDRIRALKGRPAFYLVCLTLLTAGGLVPLLLLTRQLFLPFLVRLISHRNVVYHTPRVTEIPHEYRAGSVRERRSFSLCSAIVA